MNTTVACSCPANCPESFGTYMILTLQAIHLVHKIIERIFLKLTLSKKNRVSQVIEVANKE